MFVLHLPHITNTHRHTFLLLVPQIPCEPGQRGITMATVTLATVAIVMPFSPISMPCPDTCLCTKETKCRYLFTGTLLIIHGKWTYIVFIQALRPLKDLYILRVIIKIIINFIYKRTFHLSKLNSKGYRVKWLKQNIKAATFTPAWQQVGVLKV